MKYSVDVINDLSMLHDGALEILLIMPVLCSMLFNAHYAQNYAGIIKWLVLLHGVNDVTIS